MPSAKISDAYGVTVELDATEMSIGELGKQALELFQQANQTIAERSANTLAFGFSGERRGEPMKGYGTEWRQPRPVQ